MYTIQASSIPISCIPLRPRPTVRAKEIDYVEEIAGEVNGYEFKWNPKATVKIPRSFVDTYKSKVEIIHTNNFRTFIKSDI